MGSPIPKPERQRRRRNGRRETSPKAQGRRAPRLPTGCGWPKPWRDWWRSVWSHPLAEMWSEALDYPAVFRLGCLYQSLEELDEPSAALLAQVARLEAELGLTPAARRRMYLSLGRKDDDRPASGPTPADEVGLARSRRLRAVDPALADRHPTDGGTDT